MPTMDDRGRPTTPATWLADRLMPWVAGHASVWPSTHAVHAELLKQIKEAEDLADVASTQAAFWRARAIQLGAHEGEWRAFAAKKGSDGAGA